jgi:hypothetical protein
VPKSKPTTAKQRERFRLLTEYGCIACRKKGLIRYPEIHHLVEGYRIGHDATIPLCSWHHRGVPASIDWTKKQTEQWIGPSMAENKAAFTRKYGTEKELLEEINQWLDPNHTKGGVKKANGESESSSPF